jgi:hypothetical protein
MDRPSRRPEAPEMIGQVLEGTLNAFTSTPPTFVLRFTAKLPDDG